MDTPVKTEIQTVYIRPSSLTATPNHYCPGCTHGIAHRLIAEVIEEMDIRDQTIGVAPVGCSVFAYNYFDFDFVEAAHGRAPAMATGIKRVLPDRFVFTYQGDGDLASIGMAEIMHAAGRGENITVFFINNAIYGMTGGQMAPTTLPGMKTTSSPNGRDVETGRLPPAHGRSAVQDGRRQLYRPAQPARSQEHPPGKESHPHRLRGAEARPGLLDGRAALHLPYQLGHDPSRITAMAGRAHDPRLSIG